MHFPFAGHRPDEASPLKAFGEETQPVAIGPQYLYERIPFAQHPLF